jgi:hypothetical protein
MAKTDINIGWEVKNEKLTFVRPTGIKSTHKPVK